MKRALTTFAMAAIAAAMPISGWGESAVPKPGEFFGSFPEYDPMAGGTKYSGNLSVAFVFTTDPAGCPDAPESRRVSNMFTILTLKQGNNVRPFNADFRESASKPETPSFCFLGENEQIAFVTGFIRDQVVPSLYGCFSGSCPGFKVKDLSNFNSSGTGAFSTDITIAVQDNK